ncbi:hypothetical protein DUNSADRAFT_2380 [Dunaliella salina]|uniref:Myosin motor domain-containing protein n=1 Tax=Dunaliella salina TaxID=3046 RepID=A0ABQ7GVQ4_DUNSA|nr:hypothetical protein DUNSADRAFT_2380 [Dunaliella salina]|eukprot:KAF5838685.1 hypothetical protein DUNSADRAFT_2380 [Dunaliella salina]
MAPSTAVERPSSRLGPSINDGAEGLAKGSRVWVLAVPEGSKSKAGSNATATVAAAAAAANSTWLPGELRALNVEAGEEGGNASAPTGQVALDDGRVLTVELHRIVPANPKLQEGIPDLTHLSYLNEPGITYNLESRYQGDEIYTFAGPVLIALNPCKPLPLYTPEMATKYRAGARDVVASALLPPHIYLVAANAFRRMLREKCNQSLITNPILEAFGNAKTLRNHNSSRFGKLIQMHFNASHHICGARIKTYLLEKSRVVHQLKGERSFHIFYQMLRGLKDPGRRAALHLPPPNRDVPTAFKCLAQSACWDALMRLLAGVLWLSNLEFVHDEADRNRETYVCAQGPALDACCDLLGVRAEDLSASLTRKRIIVPGEEPIVKILNMEECLDCRDALAKALYAAAFDWIVEAINRKLDNAPASRQNTNSSSGLSISILDIYGFEAFNTNSFEQLCINYANERLQQQFTRHHVRGEQQEYESEGIDWTKVEFVDNQLCVDVIEQAPPKGLGVLAVLDAQCRFPKSTDVTFVETLKEALASHPHFGTNVRAPREFTVLHYAGLVPYDCTGFLDKNKDTLNPGLKELIIELDATGLHFVRCIKPNDKLEPGDFEGPMILHQLRCCGVLEVARIARAGFPTRYGHQAFAERYSILLPPEEQATLLAAAESVKSGKQVLQGNALEACRKLVDKFGLEPSQYQVGRTKIFFRPGVLGFVEDKWAAMQSGTLLIQASWRMCQQRRCYAALRSATMVLQGAWRARTVWLAFLQMRRELAAARVVQTAWRGHAARNRFLATCQAARTVQEAWRHLQLRRQLMARVAVRREKELAARLEQESFTSLRQKFGCEMDEVHSALAFWKSQGGSSTSQPSSAGATTHPSTPFSPDGAAAAAAPSPPYTASTHNATAAAATSPPSASTHISPRAHTATHQAMAPAPAMPHIKTASPEAAANGGPSAAANSAAATAAAAATAQRFAVLQEAKETAERLGLENIRLNKQLQLERSLKERYQHKFEEQNANWSEQRHVLEEYIAQVRATFGDTRLPPLPSALLRAPPLLPGHHQNQPSNPLQERPAFTEAKVASFKREAEAKAQAAQARKPSVASPGSAASTGARSPPSQPESLSGSAHHRSLVGGGSPVSADEQQQQQQQQQQQLDEQHSQQQGQEEKQQQQQQQQQQLPQGVGDAPHAVAATGSGRPLENPEISQDSHEQEQSEEHGEEVNQQLQEEGEVRAPSRLKSTGTPGLDSARVNPLYDEIRGKYSIPTPLSPESLAKLQQQQEQQQQGRGFGKSSEPEHMRSNDGGAMLAAPANNRQWHDEVLGDDISFIQEVHAGETEAPGMDAAYELAQLKRKFEMWKREFRDKLQTADEVFRSMERYQKKAPNSSTVAPPRAPKSQECTSWDQAPRHGTTPTTMEPPPQEHTRHQPRSCSTASKVEGARTINSEWERSRSCSSSSVDDGEQHWGPATSDYVKVELWEGRDGNGPLSRDRGHIAPPDWSQAKDDLQRCTSWDHVHSSSANDEDTEEEGASEKAWDLEEAWEHGSYGSYGYEVRASEQGSNGSIGSHDSNSSGCEGGAFGQSGSRAPALEGSAAEQGRIGNAGSHNDYGFECGAPKHCTIRNAGSVSNGFGGAAEQGNMKSASSHDSNGCEGSTEQGSKCSTGSISNGCEGGTSEQGSNGSTGSHNSNSNNCTGGAIWPSSSRASAFQQQPGSSPDKAPGQSITGFVGSTSGHSTTGFEGVVFGQSSNGSISSSLPSQHQQHMDLQHQQQVDLQHQQHMDPQHQQHMDLQHQQHVDLQQHMDLQHQQHVDLQQPSLHSHSVAKQRPEDPDAEDYPSTPPPHLLCSSSPPAPPEVHVPPSPDHQECQKDQFESFIKSALVSAQWSQQRQEQPAFCSPRSTSESPPAPSTQQTPTSLSPNSPAPAGSAPHDPNTMQQQLQPQQQGQAPSLPPLPACTTPQQQAAIHRISARLLQLSPNSAASHPLTSPTHTLLLPSRATPPHPVHGACVTSTPPWRHSAHTAKAPNKMLSASANNNIARVKSEPKVDGSPRPQHCLDGPAAQQPQPREKGPLALQQQQQQQQLQHCAPAPLPIQQCTMHTPSDNETHDCPAAAAHIHLHPSHTSQAKQQQTQVQPQPLLAQAPNSAQQQQQQWQQHLGPHRTAAPYITHTIHAHPSTHPLSHTATNTRVQGTSNASAVSSSSGSEHWDSLAKGTARPAFRKMLDKRFGWDALLEQHKVQQQQQQQQQEVHEHQQQQQQQQQQREIQKQQGGQLVPNQLTFLSPPHTQSSYAHKGRRYMKPKNPYHAGHGPAWR